MRLQSHCGSVSGSHVHSVLLGKLSIDKSVVEPVPLAPSLVAKFKLHSQPRQMLRILSDDDTFVRDVNVPWMEVLKAIDALVVRFCTSNEINNYILNKTSAITVSIPSRAPTDTGSSVLKCLGSSVGSNSLTLYGLTTRSA
jgi:hypothetical protein